MDTVKLFLSLPTVVIIDGVQFRPIIEHNGVMQFTYKIVYVSEKCDSYQFWQLGRVWRNKYLNKTVNYLYQSGYINNDQDFQSEYDNCLRFLITNNLLQP
jgi:hypothetical protein